MWSPVVSCALRMHITLGVDGKGNNLLWFVPGSIPSRGEIVLFFSYCSRKDQVILCAASATTLTARVMVNPYRKLTIRTRFSVSKKQTPALYIPFILPFIVDIPFIVNIHMVLKNQQIMSSVMANIHAEVQDDELRQASFLCQRNHRPAR